MVSLKQEGYIYDLVYFSGLLIDVNSNHQFTIKPGLLYHQGKFYFNHYRLLKVQKYKIMFPNFIEVLILSFSRLQTIYFRSMGWEEKQGILRS